MAKPDQRIFFATLDQLRITAQEAWMIGGNLAFDIATAQQQGVLRCRCVQRLIKSEY